MNVDAASTVPDPAAHVGPRPWLLLIGVLALVAGCYMPVLGAPFIWDDVHLVELPLVRQLGPLQAYFAGSFWQHDDVGMVHNYYRPLTILSLALDHRVYGENPSGYHVTNLCFHLAATAVLFRLLRRDGASGNLSALASALWALAPRLTEAAAWVSGRTDVLAGFFVLSALLTARTASKLGRWATPVLLLLGLFCKETALAGVCAVLVWQWRSAASSTARVRQAAPTAVMFVSYVALRLYAVGGVSNLMRVSAFDRASAVAEAVGRYSWMLVLPWFPDVQIGNLRHHHTAFVVLGSMLILCLPVGLWRTRRRFTPAQSGYLTLAAGALGLALFAIPFSISAVAADRFLYLPLAGLALLATPTLGRFAKRRRVAPLFALALVTSFGVCTFRRAATWADEVDFWASTLRQHPEEPSMASLALATAFSREGLFQQSLAVLRRASRPGMDVRELATRNTGTTLLRSGNYDAARRVFTQLVAEHPSDPVYAINLALAELSLNRFDEARAALDRVLSKEPADAAARDLQRRLPLLVAERKKLDESEPSVPLAERARLQVQLGLRMEAVNTFAILLADPNVAPTLAEEATRFALRSADADTRQVFFERYSAIVAGRTDPELQLAYDTHRESLAKLERVWPTLRLAQ